MFSQPSRTERRARTCSTSPVNSSMASSRTSPVPPDSWFFCSGRTTLKASKLIEFSYLSLDASAHQATLLQLCVLLATLHAVAQFPVQLADGAGVLFGVRDGTAAGRGVAPACGVFGCPCRRNRGAVGLLVQVSKVHGGSAGLAGSPTQHRVQLVFLVRVRVLLGPVVDGFPLLGTAHNFQYGGDSLLLRLLDVLYRI